MLGHAALPQPEALERDDPILFTQSKKKAIKHCDVSNRFFPHPKDPKQQGLPFVPETLLEEAGRNVMPDKFVMVDSVILHFSCDY